MQLTALNGLGVIETCMNYGNLICQWCLIDEPLAFLPQHRYYHYVCFLLDLKVTAESMDSNPCEPIVTPALLRAPLRMTVPGSVVILIKWISSGNAGINIRPLRFVGLGILVMPDLYSRYAHIVNDGSSRNWTQSKCKKEGLSCGFVASSGDNDQQWVSQLCS